ARARPGRPGAAADVDARHDLRALGDSVADLDVLAVADPGAHLLRLRHALVVQHEDDARTALGRAASGETTAPTTAAAEAAGAYGTAATARSEPARAAAEAPAAGAALATLTALETST